jgi:nanoRNase/pAp phosphatase (c-di-AMP/oligoRNAs hydrolase)
MTQTFENPETRAAILERANIYEEYFEKLADMAIEKARLVSFEGYECYFANCHPLKTLKSRVGNLLAKKKGPIALVVSAHPKGYGVSIRSDGTVDVAAIAQKYGGNGHTSSAGFAVPASSSLPWTPLEDEDSSD